MKKMRLCIVDVLGLHYDGSTLIKRGLGGSESAIILMSRELAKIGFDVTVYNDCISGDSTPGTYNDVLYKPLPEIQNDDSSYDIFIASRSVAPFATGSVKDQFKSFLPLPDFGKILNNSKYKVLWMHDTFCDGDNLIEDFVLQGRINKIFTLSDFHTSYVLNADHGKKRIFEVLKKYIFMTRNGISKYIDQVDIAKKDRNLFVYNASATKGMVPLITKIWSKVKERIPDARLKIIGGYYRFKDDNEPDEQEKTVRKLMLEHPEIEFTGVIRQSEIADILANAGFMIYPAAFPETFGISSLESLYYNTPIITCNFGALEETAIDIACYKINYPIEPNWAVQWLNSDKQVEEFVNLVERAYNDSYLYQQKAYACNQVRDICGWDSIALQWKQHFTKVLGCFFSAAEYRAVSKINHKVHKVFGRRFTNPEEFYEPREHKERHIVIVTPVYNAEKYISNCILSVAQQDYDNYTMHIIDDCSTDNTVSVIKTLLEKLPKSIADKFTLTVNKENVGAVRNQIDTLHELFFERSQFATSYYNDIVMLLDGDDWLINDHNIFHKYNNLYEKGAEFTYGSCWSVADNIPLIAQPYPNEIKIARKYREHLFNWNMPYTHLRTFLFGHIRNLIDTGCKQFKDADGNWFRAGGDTSVFYAFIEFADPNKVICVPDVVCFYNDTNPLNDYKINSVEQTKTANKVLGKDDAPGVLFTPPKDATLPFTMVNLKAKLRELNSVKLMNISHVQYLHYLKNSGKVVQPKVIYDIGACVLHWHDVAKEVWKDTKFIAFDAFEEAKFLYEERGVEHYIGALQERDGDEYDYWYNVFHPGGNSLFKENSKFSPEAEKLYLDTKKLKGMSLDTIVKQNNLPLPDLIKIDVQGSELGVLKGAIETLKHVKDLIVELQHVEYNIGAPGKDEVIEFLKTQGFVLADPNFPLDPKAPDGDFHFIRVDPESVAVSGDSFLIAPLKSKENTMKKILIAIPTAKYIETETFKSIYNQIIPDGYETEFQAFYGYQVDQVRNLIAHWMVEGPYDYLFAVDSDITFPDNTLQKLLSHDVPLVSGVYRQRMEPQAIEIYDMEQKRLSWSDIKGKGLTQIGGCGFGCVLVKKEVFQSIQYPHFVYKSAIDHANTLSEDNYFCLRAREKNWKLFVNPSIVCGHIGSTTFEVK